MARTSLFPSDAAFLRSDAYSLFRQLFKPTSKADISNYSHEQAENESEAQGAGSLPSDVEPRYSAS